MACGRTVRNFGLRRRLWRCSKAAAALGLVAFALAAPSAAAPLKTTLAVTTSDGYARLVFIASGYIEGSARQTGNVLIISFKQPLDVSVDRVAEQAPDYIGAARRDPDGMAVRVALEQNVTVHAMAAGEKLFVDLLPTSWSGVPPGLPQDVVDELARRAREAEKLLQRQRDATQDKKLAPIRVHVASQPTFTRYVFNVPNQTAVSADRTKDRLILNFDKPVTFDLADAEAALPSTVREISSELDNDSSLVRFIFAAKVDVRTFRDEAGYVVDVAKPVADPNAIAPEPAGMQQDSTQQNSPPATAPATKPATQGAAGEGAAPSLTTDTAAQLSAAAAAPATIAAPVATPPVPAATAPAPAPAAASAAPAMPSAPAVAPAPAAAITPPAGPAAAANARPAAPTGAPSDASSPQSAPAAATNKPRDAAATAPSHPAAPRDGNTGGKITAELSQQGADLKLSFAFETPVGAAVFHRADTLWIVFDAKSEIDLSALDGEPSRTVRGYEFTRTADADIVRLKLDRPHLTSVAADGPVWTVEIGDTALDPTRALDITRNLIGPNRSSVTIPFEAAQQVHEIADPEVGDRLFVVTALAPARGFIDEQDFIEFHALASTQGVVIEPLADDVDVRLAPDKIVVSRPFGLTLSTSLQTLLHGSGLRPAMFDSQIWGFDRHGSYFERQSNLLAAAAEAPQNKRLAPRLDLARFYIARGMYPEAKGVLDVALADGRNSAESISALVLRAVAEVMMDRPDDALKDLAEPGVGDQHDAPLWRALAYARQGRWAKAREAFKTMEAAVATLPVELQRVALKDEMRSAIEVRDFDGASTDLNDFETIGVPHAMEPTIAVLMGRLAEGMGRPEDALAAYRTAADSWDRPAAAQGLLRETVLSYQLGDLKRDDVITQLESLTTIWRGDETEIEALKVLAHLYTEEGRYRDAFYVMRSAMAARPDSALTRQIQDEAAATFDSLFLTNKGDTMPAIDALALFYDFRELTPIGARGDEMIRRLADRLVAVDLLDQAADLLQYQVDHRLEGAARAQVATRLAVIYLMDRKPDRALATLRASRAADLSNDLRDQRLLLEARALSDLGRHELALEVIADVTSRPAIRLRADILWAAQRWDESAEQIELMCGDRYKDFQPLNEDERQDIMRAEIGYALAADSLGLGRFRDKYAAKMAETPDARAFEIVSAPLGTSGDEFATVAHAAASVGTLETFLRDMKASYPDSSAISPATQPAPPASPSGPSAPSASASPPPVTPPAEPVLPPVPPARASGRTAER
jgi:tetratricopeptide (TPR) repeat protein